MQVNELDRQTLRRLAELRPDGARVLSLFLSLDPSNFATPPARASAIRSVCDEAERRAREQDGLSHDARTALLEDVERVRRLLANGDLARGAHGLAVYACGPAGVLEAIRLPRPVDHQVVIDDSPFVAALSELVDTPQICVALVNRRTTRLLCGSSDGLREVGSFQDEVHGQHDQGGWSQARYQRSVEAEVEDHLRRAADALVRHVRRRPTERLLVGAPEELYSRFEGKLHSEVRERLAGRVEVDVEHSSPEDVHRAAIAVVEEDSRRREREALDRLAEGIGRDGRAAGGFEDVLAALYERRVETLLVAPGLRRGGRACPRCAWLSPEAPTCPVDGVDTEPRDNLVEDSVESAIAQSADVIVVRHHADLGPFEGIGAVLRF